ncbi:T-cell activation Rho GTPase-activating protein [Rhinatrema bivittatum]|uniref:T-cell activation Rho GTPase-activating protein n=1 Tax=Rhinatrema bivittatum TaxID=194408 RepID=UPI001129950F|nr:T-cell activation Rho GTPase-activating protein [Rhinatrema bivittatum]
MKVLTVCNADDARKIHWLATSCYEDGSCHLIGDATDTKKRKKIISWSFALRRSFTLSESSAVLDPKPALFKQPLALICGEDALPKPILDILSILRWKGAIIEGIFRKPANQRAFKELKDELNLGKAVDLESKSVHLLAAILKEFLREIPQRLLSSDLCHEWMAALEKLNVRDRIDEMKQLADKLPRPNLLLLRHLVCVLHHISKNSEVNKMDSSNLAICIGPNMMTLDQDTSLSLDVQKELNEKVKTLVEFLINNCFELFGDDVAMLLSGTGEDSFEQTDSAELSSAQQKDSAYDNSDREAECNFGSSHSSQLQPLIPWSYDRSGSEKPRGHLDQDSDPSNSSKTTKCKAKINRMGSEPNLFRQPSQTSLKQAINSQNRTRSHDDITVRQKSMPSDYQEPAKQILKDYFPTCLYKNKKPLSLMVNTNFKSQLSSRSLAKTSSSCSLDSSCSNSDSSVFTNSPLVSPSSPKKVIFPRHQSFCIKKSLDTSKAHPIKELKKHSMSFSFVSRKKMLTKTQSWGPERTMNLKREDSKEELKKENQLVGKTVKEEYANESQPTMPRQSRARFMSADEVFRLVDQRNPGKPPSYEEAIHKNLPAHIPPYQSMTVQRMRDRLSQQDQFIPHSRGTNDTYESDASSTGTRPSLENESSTNGTGEMNPHIVEGPSVYRTRAMSESFRKNKERYLIRRCSQPLFDICDQIPYAKESYI